MTKEDKQKLKQYARAGLSLKEIKSYVNCCNATIKLYINVFRPKKIINKPIGINFDEFLKEEGNFYGL